VEPARDVVLCQALGGPGRKVWDAALMTRWSANLENSFKRVWELASQCFSCLLKAKIFLYSTG
jgi:predicted secreted protein